MTKPTKWPVHLAKTQISLAFTQSDQSVHCSHEEAFYPLSTQRRLWSDRMAQADLSLRWAHIIMLVLSCAGSCVFGGLWSVRLKLACSATEQEPWDFGYSNYRYNTFLAANNNGTDQTVTDCGMCRLIWAFVFRTWHIQTFSSHGSHYSIQKQD